MKDTKEEIFGVTFLLIRPNGEILMQLRDQHAPKYPNMLCIPGGTTDSGESVSACLLREVDEEYAIKLRKTDCKEVLRYKLSYGRTAVVYICKIGMEVAPKLQEGRAMKWMLLSEIQKHTLAFEQNQILVAMERHV